MTFDYTNNPRCISSPAVAGISRTRTGSMQSASSWTCSRVRKLVARDMILHPCAYEVAISFGTPLTARSRSAHANYRDQPGTTTPLSGISLITRNAMCKYFFIAGDTTSGPAYSPWSTTRAAVVIVRAGVSPGVGEKAEDEKSSQASWSSTAS